MSDRIKGTIVGFALSLSAIILWVIIGFIGFIAGLAGAAFGILFLFGYNKVCSRDFNYTYRNIAACVVIVVDIIIAELVTIALIAGDYGVSLAEALSIGEVLQGVLLDIVIGLALSFWAFISYLRKNSSFGRKFGGFNKSKNATAATGAPVTDTLATEIACPTDPDLLENPETVQDPFDNSPTGKE